MLSINIWLYRVWIYDYIVFDFKDKGLIIINMNNVTHVFSGENSNDITIHESGRQRMKVNPNKKKVIR